MKIDMQNDGNVTIQLDPGEKIQISSDFTRVVNQKYDPMVTWFADPKTPEKDKAPYAQTYTRAMAGMSFLYQFLLRCGYTEDEIRDLAKIPF